MKPECYSDVPEPRGDEYVEAQIQAENDYADTRYDETRERRLFRDV